MQIQRLGQSSFCLFKKISTSSFLLGVFLAMLFSLSLPMSTNAANPSTIGTPTNELGPQSEDPLLREFFNAMFGTATPVFTDTDLKIRSQVIPENGVGAANIVNGSITGDDIAISTISKNKIVGCPNPNEFFIWNGTQWDCTSKTTIGLQTVATSNQFTGTGVLGNPLTINRSIVQLRVSGACTSGFLKSIAEDGTVTCADAGDSDPLGEIQNVSTGGGLQRGGTNNPNDTLNFGLLRTCGDNEVLQWRDNGNSENSWQCTQKNGINFWQFADANLSYNGGNVGIGTTTPTEKLDIVGNIKATNLSGTNTGDQDVITGGGIEKNTGKNFGLISTCAANEILKWTGSVWQCEPDLGITEETDPTVKNFAKADLPNCPAGQVLKGNGTTLSCVADEINDADHDTLNEIQDVLTNKGLQKDAGTNKLGLIDCANDEILQLKDNGAGGKVWQCTPAGGLNYWNFANNNLSYVAGNVGIGTANPTEKLDVTGNIKFSGNLLGSTHIGGTGVTDTLNLQGTSGNGTATSPAIKLNVGNNGGTNALTVLNNGNVGIGTTSPDSLLHLKSTVATGAKFESASNSRVYNTFTDGLRTSYIGQEGQSGGQLSSGGLPYSAVFETAGNYPLHLGTNQAVRLTVLNTSGNIGIGTTTPAGKLDIKGSGTTTGIGLQTQDSAGNVKFSVLDNGNAKVGGVSINNGIISDVSNPSAAGDAANKGYVDNAIAGLSWKSPVTAGVNPVGTGSLGTLGTCESSKQTWTAYNTSDDMIYTCNGTIWVALSTSVGTPNASDVVPGKIQIAGDLSGTYASPQIKADTIMNADVNSSAGISGTKINPNFGAQNLTTTGNVNATQYCDQNGGNCITSTSLDVWKKGGADQSNGSIVYYNNGNVGIGTNTPTEKIQVVGGNIKADAFILSNGTPITGPWTMSGTNTFFDGANTTNGANVGIGTGTPTTKLQVIGTIKATDFVKEDGTSISSTWSLNGTKTFYNAGNVGIGTNAPATTFQVSGTTGNAKIAVNSGDTTNPEIDLDNDATLSNNNHWAMYADNASGSLRFAKSGIDQLRVTNTGKLGIGLATGETIAAGLHAASSTGEQLRLESDATHFASFTTDTQGAMGVKVSGGAGTDSQVVIGDGTNQNSLLLFNGSASLKYHVGLDATDGVFKIGKGDIIGESTNTLFSANATTGNIGINTAIPTAALDVGGDTLRLRTPKTPASSTESCNQGNISWDDGYIYICTEDNQWKRSALTTW